MLNTLLNTSTLAPEAPAATGPSLIDRLRGFFGRDRAENDVAAFIQANGGVMTDQIEREISRRYGGMVGK